MRKFEVGTYRTFLGTFETSYTIEKVTEKSVVVTIHKGGKYETTKRCKVINNGRFQYAEFNGFYIESTDERIA